MRISSLKETVIKSLIERSVVLGQAGDKPLAIRSSVGFDLPGFWVQKKKSSMGWGLTNLLKDKLVELFGWDRERGCLPVLWGQAS